MGDCKFCSVLAAPDLAVALPNLILQTDTVVAVLNRRPVAPGHVTLILKAHRPQTGGLGDAEFAGFGTLAGRLSAILERRFQPKRVILLGDGKPSRPSTFTLSLSRPAPRCRPPMPSPT